MRATWAIPRGRTQLLGRQLGDVPQSKVSTERVKLGDVLLGPRQQLSRRGRLAAGGLAVADLSDAAPELIEEVGRLRGELPDYLRDCCR
jgi:hypothetical protein